MTGFRPGNQVRSVAVKKFRYLKQKRMDRLQTTARINRIFLSRGRAMLRSRPRAAP